MADKETKGVPPTPSSKSTHRETLAPYQRANTGGDQIDRMRGNYAKNPPPREDDPFGL